MTASGRPLIPGPASLRAVLITLHSAWLCTALEASQTTSLFKAWDSWLELQGTSPELARHKHWGNTDWKSRQTIASYSSRSLHFYQKSPSLPLQEVTTQNENNHTFYIKCLQVSRTDLSNTFLVLNHSPQLQMPSSFLGHTQLGTSRTGLSEGYWCAQTRVGNWKSPVQ